MRVGTLMNQMAEVLPFCYNRSVQRVQLPFLDVSTVSPGHYVYCLLSPFLWKVYVLSVSRALVRPAERASAAVKELGLWALKEAVFSACFWTL